MQVCGVIKTVLEYAVDACRLSGNFCHILLSCTLKKNTHTCFPMGKSSVIWSHQGLTLARSTGRRAPPWASGAAVRTEHRPKLEL